MSSKFIKIEANIPATLATKLSEVVERDNKTISYYVNEGLKAVLSPPVVTSKEDKEQLEILNKLDTVARKTVFLSLIFEQSEALFILISSMESVSSVLLLLENLPDPFLTKDEGTDIITNSAKLAIKATGGRLAHFDKLSEEETKLLTDTASNVLFSSGNLESTSALFKSAMEGLNTAFYAEIDELKRKTEKTPVEGLRIMAIALRREINHQFQLFNNTNNLLK